MKQIEDSWKSFKDKPQGTGRENPIWIASNKTQSVVLGYYSHEYGWFDMQGCGIGCSLWQYLSAPPFPKTLKKQQP